MFKYKEQLKEILAMELSDNEKKDLIGELETTKTDVARQILVSEYEAEEFLELEEGEIIEDLGRHFADRNDKNISNMGYTPSRHLGNVQVMFYIYNVKGYKLQYLEDLEDETYLAVMDLFGSGAEMQNECEIILSNNNKYEVYYICDERDEVGCITIELDLVEG